MSNAVYSGSSWGDWDRLSTTAASEYRTRSVPYLYTTATSGPQNITITWPHYSFNEPVEEKLLPDELFEIPVLMKGE